MNSPYGYTVADGYMGKIDDKLMLFATEEDYLECYRDNNCLKKLNKETAEKDLKSTVDSLQKLIDKI